MTTLQATMLVFMGGGIGAAARYWLAMMIAQAFPSTFPLATLAINVIGSSAIGVAAALVPGLPMRLLLIAGVLGGFTTFSTFSLDAVRLLEEGRLGATLLYATASVVLCVGGAAAGLFAGRAL